jgi:predicted nucleotidyltransferase
MALSGGADLVLELPLPFACATAETFAAGGVGIADALGCVEYLGFGMECGNVAQLVAAADRMSDLSLKPLLDKRLAEGCSFAAARTEAVKELYGDDAAELLCTPNNALAIEYIRALARLHSRIQPIGVLREGAQHHSDTPSGQYASATAVRRMLLDGDTARAGDYLPHDSYAALREAIGKGAAPADLKRCERAILARLRSMTREQLAQLPDISEGLENRVYDCVQTATSLDGLYASVKSKRYSHARVRRIVLSAFLGLRAAHAQTLPYIRILGMNARGRALLSSATPTLPLVSSYKHIRALPQEARNVYLLECHADNLWALTTPTVQSCGADMSTRLITL